MLKSHFTFQVPNRVWLVYFTRYCKMVVSLTMVNKPNGKFPFSAQFLSDFLRTQRYRKTSYLPHY